MISKDRLEEALRYLAETDEKFAELKTGYERACHKSKAVKSAVFLRLDGTVAERNAEAEKHDSYNSAKEAEFTYLKELEHVKNKRSTESVIIDVWRSLNAARRSGNVV